MSDTPDSMNAIPKPAEPNQTTTDAQHPWLGLASFTEETRGYFYGREDEVGELARRVQRKLLTVLFGQSGLGKTSILRAGIVPRLRPEGYCPVYVRIDYAPDAPSPTEQIKQAIFAATASTGTWSKSGTTVEGESLWEFLHHRDDILQDANGKTVVPLLIFDQFEEIFTIAQTDDVSRNRAATFIEDLADLVENRPPKKLEALLEEDDTVTERFDFNREDYRVLIALREDYLAHLESVKAAMPSITQNRMRLARMNGNQALAAVQKPGGRLVSQEIAEAIVRFVAGGSELPNAEVEPSLLSLICRELNNARIAKNKPEISADLLAGSHDTILAEFYERALADQPPAVRRVIEDELLTDSGYRENLAEERVLKLFTDAGAGVGNYADAKATLATLVNRRLLRTEDRLDRRRVELTHDVLCGVVKASREARLEREAREDAEKNLLAQKERERTTRQALVRARQIAMGCAALSVFAIGGAIFGYVSTERAKAAEAEAVKTKLVSETSRAEAEKLLEFLLNDFLQEMQPMGRADVVASLAQRTVEYYEKLPSEARGTVTQRNSVDAKTVYAHVLNSLGKSDEAKKWADEASSTIKALRAAGDNSDETLISQANHLATVVNLLSSRGDWPGTIPIANEALEILKPALAKPDPPRKAREAAARHYARLGDAYGRTSRPAEMLAAAQKARDITKEMGALDLTHPHLTMGYLWAGRGIGEALTRQGKLAEAKAELEQCMVLSEKLLKARPGHRGGLNNRAFLLAGLSRIEYEQLNMARQLPYLREAVKIQQEIAALQAGTAVGQGALRFAHWQLANVLFLLGRDEEWQVHTRQMLVVGKDERVSGDAAVGLANLHRDMAVSWANRGDLNRAQAEMAHAERYFAVMKAAGASERTRMMTAASLNRIRGQIALVTGGDLVAARRTIEQDAATIRAFFKDDKSALTEVGFALHNKVATELSLALGQYAEAGLHAREALSFTKPDAGSTLDYQWNINEIRMQLAIALARQGKREEANKVLVPVRAFYRLPQVMNSDDQTLNAYLANGLLAEALANPADGAALLASAMARLDAMPATLKRQKWVVRIRDLVAREQRK